MPGSLLRKMYGHDVFFDVKGKEHLSFPFLIQSGVIFSFAANTDAVLGKYFTKRVPGESIAMLSREHQHKTNKTNDVFSITRTKKSKKPISSYVTTVYDINKRSTLF